MLPAPDSLLPDLEPHAVGLAHRLEPGGTLGCLESAPRVLAVQRRRPSGGDFPVRRQRPHGLAVEPPHPEPRAGEALERGHEPLEPASRDRVFGQPARSVRHTEFPFSLKTTRSTSLRSTNRPRPSSRSSRSGSVGSGTAAGSKPAPSSVTGRRTASRRTSPPPRTARRGARRGPPPRAGAGALRRA